MPHLNLAALTAEELQYLLGEAAAQRLLPEISSARLAGKLYPGPSRSGELSFEALGERDWGASPEQSRLLRVLDAELLTLGASPLGVYYSPQLAGARHQRAYFVGEETALSLRWSETPDTLVWAPFIQAVTLCRDNASGISASLSSTSGVPSSPASSEEIDLRLLPGGTATELLAHHRQLAIRHGRGQKLAGEAGWMRAFQTVRQLNFAAWARRGLLLAD